MSNIDPTSQAQLDSILKKIGVNNEGDTKKASKDTLGQSDFLKLMTTQLQNQDPFAPMENAEFIAQMAQFSTVTGITDMNSTLSNMADQLGEFRIATAANLLGSSVMIPGNYARPDETGEIHGMLDLPSASGITNLTFSNTAGDVLHQMARNRPVLSALLGPTFRNRCLPAVTLFASRPLPIWARAWKA